MIEIVKYAVEKGIRLEGKDIVGLRGKVLKPRNIGKYLGYQIPRPEGGFTNVYAHKLIYFLATGDKRAFDSEYEVHHKNHNKHDNRPENLEVKLETEHASEHSRLNTYSAKITLETGRAIKAEYEAGGISQRSLARKHGLSQQHISDIVRGVKWGSKWD